MTRWLAALSLAAVLAVPSSSSAGTAGTAEGCFGHTGVRIGTNVAFECVFKDADEGGALYWQFNLSDVEYNLHPDGGHYVVQGVRTRYNAGFSTNTGFLAVVMSVHGGCLVVGAGYGQHPTQCQPAVAGGGYGPARPMTVLEQASYDDFAEVMGEGIPDGYWRA